MMLKLIRGAGAGAEAGAVLPRPVDELALLARKGRAGDADATRTLLVAVGPPMLQVIRRIIGTANPDVEDVFQDAAFGLVDALPEFRGDCTVVHFSCRVAVLTALAARRRQRVRQQHGADLDLEEAERVSDAPAVSDPALSARRRELLRQLLDDLADAQAEVLLLHCVAGFTLEEVAATTRVPLETARSRLRLGKAALRARIAVDARAAELLEIDE